MRRAVVRLNGQHVAKTSRGLVPACQIRQQHSQIVVRLGIVGLQSRHGPHRGQGVLRAPRGQIGRRQVHVEGEAIGVELDGAFDVLDGLRMRAALMRRHAEQMDRVRVARFGGQDLAVHPLRLVEPSRAM